jgi:hypothetical protein
VGLLSSLFGGGNPIDTLSLDDLKITEIQLNKKVDDIHAEVRRIDLDVERNYDLAKKSTSQSEEVSYARRIKTLLLKKEGKLASQAQIEKELRAVSNLVILKEREKDLPSDVVKKLKKLDPDQMEKYLIGKKLDTMNDDAQIDAIINMTSGTMEVGVEPEEDLTEILDTIRAGKEGSDIVSPNQVRTKKSDLE